MFLKFLREKGEPASLFGSSGLRSRAVALATLCSGLLLGASQANALPFTEGDLVIYRVGDGTATLANTGNQVFLDEYSPAGTLVQSIALPTTTQNGSNNKPVFASGTATSEGFLTRSADGQSLFFSGYSATNGTNLTGSTGTAVPRVVGRIDAAGSFDTSTALTDFASGNNPRTVVSPDGTNFYAAGGAGGIRYAKIGDTTSTQITAAPANIRQLNIFSGNLYGSSGAAGFRLFQVGTGLPTTTNQTSTNLPGISNSTGSPYGFVLLDLDPAVAGAETLYVADDTANAVQKFVSNGTTFTAKGTITATGVRGLTASVSGGTVTLFGTTGASGAAGSSVLYTAMDANAATSTLSGAATSLATGANGTAFRGIAFAPTGGAPAPTATAGPTPTATAVPTATPVPTATAVPTATPVPTPVPATQSLVISEVYGGGGNTGAPFNSDFIELYNGTSATIDLSSYSVQYASAAGAVSGIVSLSGSIGPGSFYLVQVGPTGTTGAPLPTPNAVGATSINISATAGKVALANDKTAVTFSGSAGAYTFSSNVVDFVGFGSTASAYEGAAAAPAPSNSTSVARPFAYGDTNQNGNDFRVQAPDPVSTGTTGAIINEFRLTGPSGPADEFIEIYNQGNTPLDLSGWTIRTTAGALVATIPPGKTLRAYSRLLLTGSTYSLADYGGINTSVGDVAYTVDTPTGSALELRNALGTAVDTVNSATLALPTSATSNYSFVRRMDGTGGAPQTGGDFNTVDVASAAGPNTTTGLSSNLLRLGAPGPQNLASPTVANNFVTLTQANPASVRTNDGTTNTLSLRRILTNPAGSGRTITGFRLRLVAATSGTNTIGVGDLRLISSSGNGTFLPMTLEAPATASANGSGLNATVSLSGLPTGGLAPGSSVNYELLFRVITDGSYRFLVNAEPITTPIP